MESHKVLHFDMLYDNLSNENFISIKQIKIFYHQMQNNIDRILDMCLYIDIGNTKWKELAYQY
jgi:hypothetical protein